MQGSVLSLALGVILALPGALFAGLGIYLLVLAIASMLRPQQKEIDVHGARSRLVVLIPAHNEEQLVARCVASLQEQSYPRPLYRIVVIADNCTDATAAVSAAAGAEVMVRDEPQDRGKGRALRWAMDQLAASGDRFDAVVVVDADSIAERTLLSALEHELAGGHPMVQADYSVLTGPRASRRTQLVAAGFLLFHRVRFAGRARLGMSASLVGNGMLFSRSVLDAHPWSAFTGVEDLEHSINLRLAGLGIRFAPAASVSGPGAATRGGEVRQRLRWEGGRFYVVRRRLWEVIRTAVARRDPGLLATALDLATPPLGLLATAALAGTVVVAVAVLVGIAPTWTLAPWLIALAALPSFIVIGLRAAHATRAMWAAMAAAPFYLAWKIAAYVSMARGFDPHRWDRSDRLDSSPRRLEIAGVPVDAVDMQAAIARLRAAIGRGRLMQVSTINLDFLVRAQRDPDMLSIFQRSDLNLADGAPVVWLGRLLGVAMPGRVAGADFVPAAIRELAQSGARLFLLGGEKGVADMAASRLTQLFPGIAIAGTYEPPRAAIADMNNAEILARIAESRADVLLVALGHPKQERWIDLHRDQLPVSVAIGVGCVFDLLAGRSRRAPRWMQAVGLEWLYRLTHEPRRLVGRYVTDAAWLLPLAAAVVRSRVARPAVETV